MWVLFSLPSWQVYSKIWFSRCLCPCVCGGGGDRWILLRSSNWSFDQFSPNIRKVNWQLASKACKLIAWGQFDYNALCEGWGGGVRRWGKIVERRWREHGWSVRVEQIRREEKLLEPPGIQSAWCYVKEKIHCRCELVMSVVSISIIELFCYVRLIVKHGFVLVLFGWIGICARLGCPGSRVVLGLRRIPETTQWDAMAHPPLPITSCDSSSDLSRLLLGKCSIWKGASRQVALSNGVGSLVSQSKNQRFDKFMKREKAKTMTYHKSQFNLHPGYISDIYENWRL